jgi:hypothetical protein
MVVAATGKALANVGIWGTEGSFAASSGRRGDQYRQEESGRVHDDVALAALDLLAPRRNYGSPS